MIARETSQLWTSCRLSEDQHQSPSATPGLTAYGDKPVSAQPCWWCHIHLGHGPLGGFPQELCPDADIVGGVGPFCMFCGYLASCRVRLTARFFAGGKEE